MRYITFSAALIISLATSAQKQKFQEGTIVTKQGDTLIGWVHWKKNNGGEEGMLFKKTESDTSRRFPWNELAEAWNRDTKQRLKICEVTRNLEYIDDNDFTIRNKDSVAVQVIPLTQVFKGRKLSLYSYYEKSTFYFLYDGKNMLQLVQKYRYLNRVERMFDFEKGRRFEITDEYRGLLARYYDFKEDQKMRYILDNTLYEEGSLKHLVSKMDDKMW